jgi:23S rRNA G2445 N2-methylase RlmL
MPPTRTLVHQALTQFQEQPDFRTAATNLFKELGYESSRVMRLDPASAAGFISRFSLTAEEFDPTKAHTSEWAQFEFLFQYGENEVKRAAAGSPALELFNQDADRGNKNSFFFHAVRLKGESYRRGVLADITRQLNRPFGLPTVVLFQHGTTISLGVISRRPNKKDATREVLEKVTLIKDISLTAPHPAHVRILDELRLGEQMRINKVTNFDTLLHGWQATLSISELNKRFYRELANWYFWAVREVRLPAYPGDQGEDVRHATAMIRLITRIIFTWFLKEKQLVPAELFDRDFVYDELMPPAAPTDEADERSTYYKAVLQNLFFATLNTEMRDTEGQPNRRFLPPSNARNQNAGYGEAGYLRYQDLFSSAGQIKILDLVNQIPFLNGGLFECLDPMPPKTEKGQPKPERILIDCFSNGNQHLMHVPDKLFFAQGHTLDLSPEYGEKTRKKETVRGLIPLLNRYKFTIAENTPLEEEVALDPELLGKVFENLLAAYNPETQTTARKQTGSFYTPREVVEYMVDESLLAYLRPHLPTPPPAAPRLAQTTDQPSANLFGEIKPQQATLSLAPPAKSSGSYSLLDSAQKSDAQPGGGVDVEVESALRDILAHPEAPNPFDKAATWKLIQAIDRLKLLDPACGSGAFPMGALQRLTYLLARLDPNNKLWKQQQLDRAEADRQTARSFMDEKLRRQAADAADRRIEEIRNAFNTNNHELDYARKLYLIENCLYGVDIQPVAVQITKLRCFIALLVEQKADTEQARQPEHNLGIRPLPNLETKFVAANTLLRLEEEAPAARRDKGTQIGLLAMDDDIDQLRQELREVRHQYFTVRGRTAKLRLRAQDADLRHRLGLALQRSGMPAADARHLAEWNPYDLKLAADFFSPKWMLGVDDGFDVVIGNPPYVSLSRMKDKASVFVASKYETYEKGSDLYCLFYEAGINHLKRNGVLTFITSNSWMQTDYGRSLRRYFINNTDPLILINLADAQIFETAIVETNIILLRRGAYLANLRGVTINSDYKLGVTLADFVSQNGSAITTLTEGGWNVSNDWENKLKIKFDAAGRPLKKWPVKIYRGITTGFNDAFVIDNRADYERLLAEDPKSSEVIKPILRGRDLRPYSYKFADNWIIFSRRGIDIKKYPKLENHLKAYHAQLKPKSKGDKIGRKPGGYNWYEIQDNTTYYSDFDKPKIIWSKLCDFAKFTYDTSGHYLLNTVLFMVGEDLKYILAVMGSKPCQWYFNQIATTTGMGTNEWINNRVEKLSVPLPTAAQKEEAETLVNQILAAKAASATADTTALERQVDALVYKLYDLRDDEIALVEGRSA